MKKFSLKFASVAAIAVVLALVGFNRGAVSYAFGDDLIGSLPIMYPYENSTASPPLVPAAGGDGEECIFPTAFIMEGTMRDIESLVADAIGVGYVQVEKTSNPDVFKYVFHGNVMVDLTRRELLEGAVKLSVRTGPSYVHSKGIVTWKGKLVNVFKVNSQELNLPFQDLLLGGVVDQGAVGLKFHKPKAFGSLLNMSASPNLVRINSVSH